MSDIKNIIQHIAPSIGSALDGPFSGVALKYIKRALSAEDIENEKIGELLNEHVNLLKIKDTEEKFKEEMLTLGIDIKAISAPNSSQESSLKQDRKPQIILSCIFICAYFLMVAAMFFVEVSDSLNMRKGENSLLGELQILFGVLTAGVGQVLSYWFGGSKK